MKRERNDAVVSSDEIQERRERERQILNLRHHLVATLRDQVTGNSASYEECACLGSHLHLSPDVCLCRLVQEVHVLFRHVSTLDCPAEQRKLQILLSCLAGCASEIVSKHHSALCNEILDIQFMTQPKVSQTQPPYKSPDVPV